MRLTPPKSRDDPPKIAADPVELLRRVCRDNGITYDGQECLKQDQVAMLLGVSKRTVQRMIDESRLNEAYRLNGKPRYRLADLAPFWEPPNVP